MSSLKSGESKRTVTRLRRDFAYYDQPEIREWVEKYTGRSDISFSAVAANWRGVLSPLSADFLKSVLKLSNWDVSLLGLRICEETYHIHRYTLGKERIASGVVEPHDFSLLTIKTSAGLRAKCWSSFYLFILFILFVLYYILYLFSYEQR